jgi:hypothetical protein
VEVIPSMDHVLRLVAQHLGLPEAPSIGTVDLQILTDTIGLVTPATQNQIILHWVLLIRFARTAPCPGLDTGSTRGFRSSSRRFHQPFVSSSQEPFWRRTASWSCRPPRTYDHPFRLLHSR